MLPNGQMVPYKDFKDFKVHCIPITGDQVTVARICGARATRHGSKNKLDCLKGIVCGRLAHKTDIDDGIFMHVAT